MIFEHGFELRQGDSKALSFEHPRVLRVGECDLRRLQVDDGADLSDEAQPVAAAQNGFRRHGRDDGVAPVDRGEKDAGEVAQSRLSDRLAVDRSAGGDHHLDGEAAGLFLQLDESGPSRRQHVAHTRRVRGK